jgi:hypothetical protein
MITAAYAGQQQVLTVALVGVQFIAEVLRRTGGVYISARTDVRASDDGLGAGERIRTADLPFTRRLLCQLSYTGGRLGAW